MTRKDANRVIDELIRDSEIRTVWNDEKIAKLFGRTKQAINYRRQKIRKQLAA